MSRFCLPDGYEERLLPADFDDFSCPGSTAQAAVYRYALERARALGVTEIVDLGCGAARKSLPWAGEFYLLLVDREPIVRRLGEEVSEFARVRLEARDFEREFGLPVSNALIVCADVVEHLVDPTALLESVKKILRSNPGMRAVFSTPCRTCGHLVESGPPSNPCHAREWRHSEFFWLLENAGLRVEASEHLPANDDVGPDDRGTFLCEVRYAP